MTSLAPDPTAVSAMGKYTLIAELARGGMGNVYLAALSGPAGFNKLLVVKELKPELCYEPSFVSMFLEEARLAALLTHPNIVQLYDVGLEGGRYFIAMEYLDGRSLARILSCFAREGRFPLGAHLRILGDCLMGLHYAHELRGFEGEELGLVHRDVSPFNVMVTFDGQVKLLDFGIAKATDSPSDTKAGVVKGKVAYMAPEQAAGARVDRRADVYSAGVMIWEAAAGQRMWPGMSEVEVLGRVLRDGAPRLRDVNPDASIELDVICARATAKDRNDRYATAAELLQDLEGHLTRRNDVMGMRQIGEFLSALFADERQKMAQLIEETLTGSDSRSGLRATLQSDLQTQAAPLLPWADGVAAESRSRTFLAATGYAAPMSADPAASSISPSAVSWTPPGATPELGRPPRTWKRTLLGATVGAAVAAVFTAVVVDRIASDVAPSARGGSVDQASSARSLARDAVPVPSPQPVVPEAPQATELPSIPATTPKTDTSVPPKVTLSPRRRSNPKAQPQPSASPSTQTSESAASASVSASPPPVAATPPAAIIAPAAPSVTRRPPAADCDPPYTVDSNGIEHFKPSCLEGK